jgi:NAD(P)-dependent dehydrogenase (short-subunit alcohol dehydrogenase family)
MDRNAVVTGASRGLGRALAEALVRDGWAVALVARGEAALDAAVAEITAGGGRAIAVPGDVGDPEDAVRIVAEVNDRLGPITLLVNNASTLGPLPLPLLLDLGPEALADALNTNVVGPFRLTKAVVGSMLLRGHGDVVAISSDAAVSAYPRWGAYAAGKAAFDVLTRTMAAELDGTGVRLFAVDPGEMDTQMHADAIPDADPASLQRPQAVAARILAWVGDRAAAPSGARVGG